MADIMKVCIATSKAPTIKTKDAFIEEIKNHAKGDGLEVVAMLGREGFGCYNLGLAISGPADKVEAFVNGITMGLGPISRWGYCTDKFEGFVLEDLRE
jgi:hypothetical protein